jgi:hypothetical protein
MSEQSLATVTNACAAYPELGVCLQSMAQLSHCNLNGPIFPVVPQSVPGSKRSSADFVHPGLWHTHSDLETIRNNLLNGVEPWKTTYEKFSIDKFSLANYTMRGPNPILSRGTISNYTSFTSDVRAAYQNALMCMSMDKGKITPGC